MRALFTSLSFLLVFGLSAQQYQDDCQAIEDIVNTTVVDLWQDLLDPATSVWCGTTFQSPSDSLHVVTIVVFHTDSLIASQGGGTSVLMWSFPKTIGSQEVGGNVEDLLPGTQYFAAMRIVASESVMDFGQGIYVCDHTGPVFSVSTLAVSTSVEVLGSSGLMNIHSDKNQLAKVYNLSGQLVDQFPVSKGTSVKDISRLLGCNIIRFQDGTTHKIFVQK